MQNLKLAGGYIRTVTVGRHQIPILNIGAVLSGGQEVRRRCAAALDMICRDVGVFYIENHGIEEQFLLQVEQQIHEFFGLPESEKMKIHISKSPYHRGYVPNGEENALYSKLKDVKEVFDMALELPPDDPDVIAGKFFHGPNAWPDALPEFKPTLLQLYEEWRRLGGQISKLFALALNLPEDFFVDRTSKPLAQLRIAKYPPQKSIVDDGSPIGCGAHTDYSICTFIWQIDKPGLQVLMRDGEWIDAPRIPGAFVCPLGDAIAMWTNDYWPATIHRVINTLEAARYSSAFFFDPNDDCEIAPLEQFVSPSRPARYEPTTMGAHVKRGFDGTFEYRARKMEETVQ